MSKTTNKFSPEVRERAVRLVFDNEGLHVSRWQAIVSIAAKIGCSAHMPAVSWAGASAPLRMLVSSSTPLNRRCMIAAPERAWGWSTTATGAPSVCASATPNVLPKQALSLRLAVSATVMTVSLVSQPDGLTHVTIDHVSLC
jgi:hypothetical protein